MTKQDFFRADWLRRTCRRIRNQLQDVTDKITNIVQQLSDVPRSKSHLDSKVERLTIRKLTLETALADKTKELEDLTENLRDEIAASNLSIRDKTVLTMYYVDGVKTSDVAQTFFYSVNHVRKIRHDAIKKLKIRLT